MIMNFKSGIQNKEETKLKKEEFDLKFHALSDLYKKKISYSVKCDFDSSLNYYKISLNDKNMIGGMLEGEYALSNHPLKSESRKKGDMKLVISKLASNNAAVDESATIFEDDFDEH